MSTPESEAFFSENLKEAHSQSARNPAEAAEREEVLIRQCS
jgi:hypothetical protein